MYVEKIADYCGDSGDYLDGAVGYWTVLDEHKRTVAYITVKDETTAKKFAVVDQMLGLLTELQDNEINGLAIRHLLVDLGVGIG